MKKPVAAVSKEHLEHLILESQRRAPLDVAQILLDESDETVGAVLKQFCIRHLRTGFYCDFQRNDVITSSRLPANM